MELQLPGGWKSKTKSFNIISNVDLSKFCTAAFRKPPRPRNVGNDPERWRIGFKARTLTFVCEGRIEVFLYSSVHNSWTQTMTGEISRFRNFSPEQISTDFDTSSSLRSLTNDHSFVCGATLRAKLFQRGTKTKSVN